MNVLEKKFKQFVENARANDCKIDEYVAAKLRLTKKEVRKIISQYEKKRR